MEEFEKISNDLITFIEDNKQNFNTLSICGFINCIHRLKVLHTELYEKTNDIIKTNTEYVAKEITVFKKEQAAMYRFLKKELKDIKTNSINSKN
tara:strand:+ start:203 stop:484 length:282 start_codon:yes stop_codon:yes gene_type:complete